MFTPNGRRVCARTCSIARRTSSTVLYPAAMKPSPPPSETAAASSGVDAPPASGAPTTGISAHVLNASVFTIAAHHRPTSERKVRREAASGLDHRTSELGLREGSQLLRWQCAAMLLTNLRSGGPRAPSRPAAKKDAPGLPRTESLLL